MDTLQYTMNNNYIDILNKINYLKEQITIRKIIPYDERTNKQLIKLDNLQYELRQLQQLILNLI